MSINRGLWAYVARDDGCGEVWLCSVKDASDSRWLVLLGGL
jgi:hypothetical protein